MTEEEQLALAVQMSQQEQAKPEGYTQEEEDELIKKAIEESLHSCQVPDILVSATKDELTSGASSSHEYCEKEPHSSKESKPSGEISAKSPVVRLQRLSQDIVESSSVILSPNCKDPISCIENCLQSALSPCTSSNFVKASPAKELALSPVFPKKSPRPCKLIPCRLFQEISPSVDRPVDDLDDQCTHCSESPQIDSLSMLPTSCSQGESLYQNDCGKTETFHTDKAKKLDCEKGIESSDCRAGKTNQSGGTVHYYWGVPFCPKGVDPSEYTKVILCQLEVYQKSLKSAQRQLLHKMDYGQPIHLTASSRKYFKEDTQGSVSQEDTEECVAEDNTQKPDEDETERDDNSDSQETQYLSSKRQKISQSPAQTGLENDHCSSSQDENDSVKMPFTQLQPSECAGVAPVAPGESAVSPTAVRNDRHLKEHPDIAQEEEITVCPETQPCPAKQEESDKEDQTDIMENSSDPQVSNSSDEDLICLNKVYKNVACPMCGCNFSRTQIERHAAYCDGTKRQQEMAVLRPRNKLRRSHDSSAAVSITSSDSGKCEKCYLCKLLVPLKDYQAHVDNCLQTAMLETQGSQRLRSVKEYPERNCRLLSMLEHSESSLAETNGNAPEPSHLSPPREEHGAHFSSEHLNLSDSPIRSFVAISEATDCLVDFKKQFSRRPGSRGAGRRGKRRRM
ncbi:BRCA1-A complex subunit RAP80 isoform X1 [Bufo gargarizans]|uniref:BRCA1-A complex subunit RAP80 isoform X1 n=2 Tax=Bufo gargarizans TaxID=30331 RepID=UPI001CF2D239|nr:BRCA1-A complex subunit RAP80 isoform X1 [Bufo gargarizans]